MRDLRRRDLFGLLGGAAVAGSHAARAEPASMPTVGFLSTRSPDEAKYVTDAFLQGLNDSGYVEGRNLAIEFRWAELQYDRLPALASDLVRRKVAVIAAVGGAHSGLAAKALTSTIPIVFVSAGDPVRFGLVSRLDRPDGNVTGISMTSVALAQKRLELLGELVPAPATIAMLVNPASPYAKAESDDVLAAARTLGRRVLLLNAETAPEIDAAFATLGQRRAGALLVSADPYFDSQRDRIVALAARYAVAAIYQWREFTEIGGLISYGSSILDAYREGGGYVGKILDGARPASLPVLQPTRFELVVNLKTAKTLGLTVPTAVLTLADQVIE
jgi:putative tryptophan/tyrosine transport system substrate-binding protein